MSEAFTKLFSSILRSTIWLEDHETRIVWITMLALADQRGYVGASIPGLARVAGVPVEKALQAIEKFLGPDPYSRSKEHDGRRIEEADRGWKILNYLRFREERSAEIRRENDRERKRRQRSGQKRTTADIPQSPPRSAQAEAEAEDTTCPPDADAERAPREEEEEGGAGSSSRDDGRTDSTVRCREIPTKWGKPRQGEA